MPLDLISAMDGADEEMTEAMLTTALGLPPRAPPPPTPGSVAPATALVCHCEPGWTGHDCGTQQCPARCHGHGLCLHGRCRCFRGFAGVDCGQPRAHVACAGSNCTASPEQVHAELGVEERVASELVRGGDEVSW